MSSRNQEKAAIDQALSADNLGIINQHRSLLRLFLAEADHHVERLAVECSLMTNTGPAWRQATRLQESLISLSAQVTEFSKIPHYGLKSHLMTHVKASQTVLGQQNHQEFVELSNRIFSYLKMRQAAQIWLNASLAKNNHRGQTTYVSINDAEQNWQLVLLELEPAMHIERRAFPKQSSLVKLGVVPDANEDGQIKAWPNRRMIPTKGNQALWEELALRTAGSRYIALGQY